MIMAVGLVVLVIDSGQMSEGSCHNEIDYNSLKCYLGVLYKIELECILNGLPRRMFALSE